MTSTRVALSVFFCLAAVGCGGSTPLGGADGGAGKGSGAGGSTGSAGATGGAGTVGQPPPSSGAAGTTTGAAGTTTGAAGTTTGAAGTTTGAAGSRDAGTDAGPGACNVDTDCIFQANAGCCGQCLAKADPVPPRLACGVACLVGPTACACVNHNCAAAPQCLPPNAGVCLPCPLGSAPVPGPGGCVTCQCAPVDAGANDAPVDHVNPPKCPATFSALAVGAACPTDTGTCDFAEGRCRCNSCFNTDGGMGTRWDCRRWDTGGTGCPPKSPPAGSSCSTEGIFCTYGGICSIPVGDNVQCMGGTWQLFRSPMGTCAYPRCGP